MMNQQAIRIAALSAICLLAGCSSNTIAAQNPDHSAPAQVHTLAAIDNKAVPSSMEMLSPGYRRPRPVRLP